MQSAHGTVAAKARLCILALLCWLCLGDSARPDSLADSLADSRPDSPADAPIQPADSLSQRIDALLAPQFPQLVASRSEDGPLLRRLSLDLRGVVPTTAELDAFAADTSPERWQTWVKNFTSDPLCDEHLVNFLDRTLMLRRNHAQVDRATWLAYLREQVANNVGLEQFTKQLLYSPWWNRDQRAAHRFYLDRGGDPHLITRDIGRVFLGRDMQCAQCHDHPLVEGYRQIDYHGLLAFSATSGLTEVAYKDGEGKDQKVQLYVERAAGDAAFESVFEKGVPFRSGPRLPGQAEQFEDYVMPDQRYLAEAPAGALAGVAKPPHHSRRQMLADQLASRSNPAFVGNWANRLWALAFGQGLVVPLDMHHPANPALYPELYALISQGLIECEMQPRRFLEQIVLTDAYRRGGLTALPANSLHASMMEQLAAPEISGAAAQMRTAVMVKRGDADQQTQMLAAAESTAQTEYEATREAWRKIQGQRAGIRSELDKAEAAMLDAKKKSTEAAAALAAAQKKQTDAQSRLQLLDESAGKLQQAVDLGGTDDAELKQAVATAKQRAETTRGQIPALDKAVVDAQAASTATVPVLAAATTKVEELVGTLKPVLLELVTADTTMTAAYEKWSSATSSVQLHERHVQHLDHIVAWLDSLDVHQQAATELASAGDSLVRLKEQLAAANVQLAAAQSKLTAAQPAEQSAASEFASARMAMERHNAELAQLQQAIDSLIASTKLVSAADALITAQKSIQNELESRRAQTGQFQAAIDKANQAVTASAALIAQLSQDVSAAQTNLEIAKQHSESAASVVAQEQMELEGCRGKCGELWTKVAGDAVGRFSVVGLQPLSPEQLCWSTLRVTGQLDAYIQAEAVELEKQSPLAADADDIAKRARKREAVRKAIDKLRGNADVYVSLYSSGPDKTQDDFFASADQALYAANAGNVYAWAGPGNNNPTQLAIAAMDPIQVAQTLYWGLLCRKPTAAETNLVAEQLSAAGDGRNAVIQEMAWGLLVSAEFRFNQ